MIVFWYPLTVRRTSLVKRQPIETRVSLVVVILVQKIENAFCDAEEYIGMMK